MAVSPAAAKQRAAFDADVGPQAELSACRRSAVAPESLHHCKTSMLLLMPETAAVCLCRWPRLAQQQPPAAQHYYLVVYYRLIDLI